MKRPGVWPLLAGILILLTACGTSKTYIVDIRYVPQTPPRLEAEAETIGLAPFVDRRGRDRDLGIRKRLDGTVDHYRSARTSVAEDVRRAAEKLLRANGFGVVQIEGWDLKATSLEEIEHDLVVGGEINRFWSQAESRAGRTVIRTAVELTVYLGKPREGKVLKQTIEMSSETTEIILSVERIQEALNELLSQILEEAFEKLFAASESVSARQAFETFKTFESFKPKMFEMFKSFELFKTSNHNPNPVEPGTG